MEIIFFNRRTEDFFRSLPAPSSRLRRTFDLLVKRGNHIGLPHVRALGHGLFELRIVGQIQVRFIFAFYEDKIWMLHGFIKKTGRIPLADLAYAKNQHKLLLQ